MKTMKEIMELQVPQIMAFITVHRALTVSMCLKVITSEEYDFALANINKLTGGKQVDEYLGLDYSGEGDCTGSHVRIAFLRRDWSDFEK